MSMRSFADPEGKEWQAFDVVPRVEERRSYDRRSAGSTASSFVRETRDRRDGDRRVTVGRHSSIAGVNAGWLCFERVSDGGLERRRLSPIPADWRKCSDETLEQYWRAARPVRRDSVSLGELANRLR